MKCKTTPNTGAIDADELSEALEAMGHKMTREEVLKMMQDADDDGGGEIDFEEFCKLMGMDSGVHSHRNTPDRSLVMCDGLHLRACIT